MYRVVMVFIAMTGTIAWLCASVNAGDISREVRVLVAYHSASGNTGKMAEAVADGARTVAGVHVVMKRVEQVMAEDLFG
ncbi:MAG TPA: hypothetical protein VFG71_09370, partial [Nitrospiraceae bacterium]|nr:hypothetical protein [Nitrospiraceae bacterium]